MTAVSRTRHGTAWWGRGTGVVGYVAATPAGVHRIGAESARTAWAAAAGIATPRSVHVEEGILVRDRLTPARLREADAAPLVDLCDRIAAASVPAPIEVLHRWDDASWSSLPERALRALVSRLPVREFLRVRAEAAALPAQRLAHGDFRDENLLWDAGHGRVAVIDWEYLAPAPEGTDLLTLWALPVDPQLRRALLDAALERAGDPRDVAVLAHWLALRQLFDVQTARSQWDDPDRCLHTPLTVGAAAAVREARLLRERVGAA